MRFALCWTILRKHWKIIITCCLLAGLSTLLVCRWITPLYQSTALIQVLFRLAPGQSEEAEPRMIEQLVQTEARLAISDPVLREVASHYRGSGSEQLQHQISAEPQNDTMLLAIHAQDANPVHAAELANDVALTLTKLQTQIFQQNAPQSSNFLTIVQSAQPVTTPIWPDIPLLVLLGSIAGLLLGLLTGVLYEVLDTRVRTTEALAQLLGWPVLAILWKVDSGKENIIHPSGNNPNVEAYRMLRTNIGFTSVDRPLRTLAITSAVPHEGKSVVASNLAIYMAKAGKNTLLVDADLRCPTVYEKFDLPADRMGLSNAIMVCSHQQCIPPSAQSPTSGLGGISLEPFMHSVGIPNLLIMPSGPLPPNPPELLDSKGMERLLSALLHCGAEMIIFDLPPLLGLSDAAILAPKVDGTLLVSDCKQSRRGNLKQAREILVRAGARVIGCVANRQPRKRRDEDAYASYTQRNSASKIVVEHSHHKHRQLPVVTSAHK